MATTTPTSNTNTVVNLLSKFLLACIKPLTDNSLYYTQQPFRKADLFLPHIDDSRWWGVSHYAVAIADLPEPYRYMNILAINGASGTLFVDNDYLSASDVRNTSTLISSTAFGDEHHYKSYDMLKLCSFSPDGSRLAWGDDLIISTDFPNLTVTGRFHHMHVDLQISATDQVSWFSKTPIYDHLCLFATYSGTIKDIRGTTDVSGLCSVEYARIATPQSFFSTPLSPQFKIPLSLFTYQVVNLDKRTQLLLSNVHGAGMIAHRSAHIRQLDAKNTVYSNVAFEVIKYCSNRQSDPIGRTMRVPEQMRWIVHDGDTEIISLNARIDSPLRYGLCRGYAAAYRFTGQWRERQIKSIGYVEWVDCEG